MKLLDVFLEADITDRIAKDPQRLKLLTLAMRHDHSLPRSMVGKLGPRHTDQEAAKAWSDAISHTLERTNYGDLSRDFKYADWLTKLYTSGAANYEDVTGEGGDALGAWHALSIRGKLKPADQDLNRFNTLSKLQRVMNTNDYRGELEKIRNAERINKMKKDAKEIVLVDNDRYWVAMPLSYGACYVFNYTGHPSNFCTGGSSGEHWFKNYAPDGPIIMVVDKKNANDKDGKWQLHAATRQIVNSSQDNRYDVPGNDKKFAELFPGLLREIGDAMEAKKAEIDAASKSTFRSSGYNVSDDVAALKNKFPASWASRAKDEVGQDQAQGDLLGTEQPAEEPAPAEAPWYQRYLHREFRNNLPGDDGLRKIRITKLLPDGTRRSLKGNARSVAEIMNRIRNRMPDWLADGSIVTVEPAV